MTNKTNDNRKNPIPVWAILTAILALALLLRLVGIWRAEPIDYHPDEWVIAQPVLAIANEGQFGLKTHYKWPACSVIYTLGLSLYALKGLFGPYNYETILIIQRVISALAGTGAVAAAFILMRKLFNPMAGLFAAALISVSKQPVLQGHHGTITSIVSLIILVVMLLSFDLFDVSGSGKGRLRVGRCILLGLICGLGIAAKWTIVFAAIPISGAFLLSIWFRRRFGNWSEFIKVNLKRIGIIAGMSVAGFLAGIPDFLIAPDKIVAGLQYEILHHETGHYGAVMSEEKGSIARVGRTIKLMSNAGSIYLFIPAAAALVYCFARADRWRMLLIYTLLVWLAMLYRNKLAAERHHLVPFIIMVLILAVALAELIQSKKKWLRPAGCTVFILLLAVETLYTCVWISPFWKPDARVQCGRWIMENVPPGSGVTWAPRTSNWTAPGTRIVPELFKKFPRKAKAGADQYIIASNSKMEIFSKHPPTRPVVASEWFPQQPPSMQELLLYFEMNTGKGTFLSQVREFENRAGFLGFDLSWFGFDPNTETTFANRAVTLFKVKGDITR
ncbi:hypothetical protein ES707_18312 [subsurface metagenome]